MGFLLRIRPKKGNWDWCHRIHSDWVSCTFISRVACSRIPASESDQGVLIFRDPDISMLWFSILRWISHLRPLYAPIRRERGFSEPIKMRFWALAMRRFFKSVPTHGGIFYSKEIRVSAVWQGPSTNVDETLAGWRPASSNDLLGTYLCVLPVN